ncbi:hypothetical protein [Shimia thalassica]|nr:hypothetical protein [Shimia thalassica]
MKIRQHVGIDVSGVYARTTTDDEAARMPVAFAPAGCEGHSERLR